jgi:hypothetical protein
VSTVPASKVVGTRQSPARVAHGAPAASTRPYTGRSTQTTVLHRSHDVRYHRPSHVHVRHHPHAHAPPPQRVTYRPYYTRYYCHPWYRYQYATTVVVGFGFGVYAWNHSWAPPYRAGWAWVPGYWNWGYWHPGYWAPTRPAPVHYVYVPGSWYSDAYVEGYYRADARDGWVWVDGYYLEDGTAVPGHWLPDGEPPQGYMWEPGFFDGESYVDGFWRPEFRAEYTWLSAFFDEDGVYNAGYWLPLSDRFGEDWVPGWFDGNTWVEGYWVPEDEVASTDLTTWESAEGYDDGWDSAPVDIRQPTVEEFDLGDAPLALPVPYSE